MKKLLCTFIATVGFMASTTVIAVPLGTVEMEVPIANQKLTFPVALDLDIKTVPTGFEMVIVTDLNLAPLQTNIDTIAKGFPMPNDNCPGYGQHVLPTVKSVSLNAAGGQAKLNAKVDAAVWDCQKGIPLGGTTVRWRTECYKGFWGKVCWDVPYKVEPKPSPDIKNRLFQEGFEGDVTLALVAKDSKTLEIVPSNVKVEPRGDLMKFINSILGIFNTNFTDMATKEISKAVDAGSLRQTLPKELEIYNPALKSASFATSPDGNLIAHVEFSAMLTKEQLADMIKQSISKKPTPATPK